MVFYCSSCVADLDIGLSEKYQHDRRQSCSQWPLVSSTIFAILNTNQDDLQPPDKDTRDVCYLGKLYSLLLARCLLVPARPFQVHLTQPTSTFLPPHLLSSKHTETPANTPFHPLSTAHSCLPHFLRCRHVPIAVAIYRRTPQTAPKCSTACFPGSSACWRCWCDISRGCQTVVSLRAVRIIPPPQFFSLSLHNLH
jgi:hypothetical protein